MTHQVRLKASAEKELVRLPEVIHDAVIEKLLALAENPRPSWVKKLRGRAGYRVRVGDYRIVYLIEDAAQIVRVLSIAHRRDVYR